MQVINSKKGLQMYNSVSPIYDKNIIMQAIFEAIGSEADLTEKQLDDIMLQIYPQTATWGLVFWEERYKLQTNLDEPIEIRRAKVISRIQTKNKIVNPKRIELTIKNFIKAQVEVLDSIAPYILGINITSEKGFHNSLNSMYKEVKRIKPSHMGVKYNLISRTKSNLYIGAACITGHKITIYPWKTKKLTSKGKISMAGPIIRSSQHITIYPKQEKE
ncbi:DUF2313 domain-containing protein [Clostridium botulinum]|uniref:Phage protein XkdU n=1 Tax=Clostridium botulinum (strain Eklund 17B / Type B) TaxID=935198 RepID=B2TNU8_CLOBB|nr:putative phage protein XkdU [Clostridium botulinum B str. Eklund 17B (NRP)]MBY6976218.1 YmfQ family protein [Clostridium botulinum]MBY7000643.1 YmfQ family protein [Clostridium botulinum]MCR1273407.1 YmfQ family protein [Clostridium botulinum]NFD71333.1 DUF2313 domain-containing protein [Clostridium botulinum]